MKKITIIAVVLLSIVAAFPLWAEEKNQTVSPENVISVNTYPYLMALFNGGYERKIIDNLSLRARGMYWGLSQNGWSIYGFGGDFFFYPQTTACKGWYFGPRFDAWMTTYSKDGLSATAVLYFVGGQAGYRWLFDGGFAMALSLGAIKNIALTISSPDSNFNETPPFKEVMLPTFDFELGYAF